MASTIEIMTTYEYKDIATIAISLAKVMKQVKSRGQKAAAGSLYQTLYNLLLGGASSKRKHFIFSEIAMHAIPNLSKFEARHLSNLIYAFSLAEVAPKVEDGRTFFDVVALEAMSKLQHFNSQDLSNMLWAYAKMGSSNIVLFKATGDLIVGMKDLSTFLPQHLSNIIWACATADESHQRLFLKLSNHIVAMKDLGQFKPQELSNIAWA